MGNKIILAAAGAGKTERIVAEALSVPGRRVLITTYTNRNVREITDRLISKCGIIPCNIQVDTWFSFLLRHAIKPYQGAVTRAFGIYAINFETKRPRYVPKNDDRYYFDNASNLYKDGVSDLACAINETTKGKTILRLQQVFDVILIDEIQDLAGYDLDFIDMIIDSNLELMMVGDPRQATYASNDSPKNKHYRGFGLCDWVEQRRKRGAVSVEHMNWSYRCNQSICIFSDALFPDQPATEARNRARTQHDGIYLVTQEHLRLYTSTFNPMVLRWSRIANVAAELQAGAANIGDVKGAGFDRVLIFPTSPMLKYLRTGDSRDAGEKCRFYVAATRARYSVAFVVPNARVTSTIATSWQPSQG